MITTGKEIMDKSLELFNEYGYNHVSVKMICDKLHVTRGSFYHHFKSKDDLLIQWLELKIEELSRKTKIDDSLNPYQQLKEIALKYGDVIESIGYPLLRDSLYALFRINDKDHSIQDLSLYFGFHFLSDHSVLKLIEEAISLGYIKSEYTARALNNIYSNSIIGLCINWCLKEGGFDLKDEINKTFMIIFGDGTI